MGTVLHDTTSRMQPGGSPRLLDQLRQQIRLRHYSLRTEQAYVGWAKRFIIFHGRRHPASMGAAEVEQFLSHLASERNVASATQGQALSAVMFLYKSVLKTDLPWLENVVRSARPRRLPVVLTQAETRAVISHIQGTHWLIAALLYGSGLRVMEALRLRAKDIDLKFLQLTVRDGKGGKDRVTVLPEKLVAPLTVHLARVREQHELAMASGFGALSCRSLSSGNIRARIRSGVGSTCSRRTTRVSIRDPGCADGRTWSKSRCSGQCVRRFASQASSSRRRRTLSATVLPRTCWKRPTTSGRCRNYWVTRMYRPRRSTRT